MTRSENRYPRFANAALRVRIMLQPEDAMNRRNMLWSAISALGATLGAAFAGSRANAATEAAPPEADGAAGVGPVLEARLEELLGSLPEQMRIAVVLRYQEDMMPDEIAAMLGQPVATVKSNLQRGIKLLRRKAEITMKEYVR